MRIRKPLRKFFIFLFAAYLSYLKKKHYLCGIITTKQQIRIKSKN